MTEIFIHLFIALFVIADPFGNIPVFLKLTSEVTPQQRRKIISKALIFATLILISFAFIGEYILNYLNLSLASLEIAGGILLLIIAIGIIFDFRKLVEGEGERKESIAVIPLATPLIAGPGAIATVMIFTTRARGIEELFVLGAILLAMFLCWLILLHAEYLLKLLKKEGVNVLTKIIAIILAAVAVEMIFRGIQTFLA